MFHEKFSLIFLLIFIVGVYGKTETQNLCVLPLKADYTFFTPLIFNEETEKLISNEYGIGNSEQVVIPGESTATFSCAPNYFKHMPKDKVIRATCQKGQKLLVKHDEKDFVEDFSCEMRVIEEILKPVEGCPTNMDSIEYGFTNPINEKSYVLGEACLSTKKGKTLFVHTRMRSEKNDISDLALKIGNVNYFRNQHPSYRYKVDLMKALRLDLINERFGAIMGIPDIPVIGHKKFVDAEMLTHKQYLQVLRLAWNYAITFDDSDFNNWATLQQEIVNLKVKNVDIWTGSNGVTTIKGADGNKVDMFLQSNKFPVPKYLWIVVKSDDKATAFAMINNPNISDDDLAGAKFCTSKCDQLTWIPNLLAKGQYKNKSGGYVLCCDYNDFKQAIGEMPELTGITGLLK